MYFQYLRALWENEHKNINQNVNYKLNMGEIKIKYNKEIARK